MEHSKVNRIFVVRSMFLPNSAVNNRMMGHLKAFSQSGMEVEAAFISPNSRGDKVEESIPNVRFHYCWGKSKVRNRFVKRLFSYVWAIKYVLRLPTDASVLLLGVDEYMQLFLLRKDIKLYYETTEHPSLTRNARQISAYVKRCKRFKHIFVISRSLRQFFLEGGIPEDRLTIVNMTVDPSRFERIEKHSDKEPYVAYCGTVSNNKDGVDDLLRAFAITLQTHPDVKLYIIGSIPDEAERASNLKLIQDLQIEDNVVLTGIVSATEMPQMLKNAVVMALDRPDSLQAQNGFPTKLGEYLLTGNPVVVTKVGDIPLFLKDGESALLCRDRNTSDFSSKLSWALDHPEEAYEIGASGREIALKTFNYKNEGKKILDAIRMAR